MTKLSVIMACRNEADNIKDVLFSLLQQTIRPTNVIIVDDASTDQTFEIARRFTEIGWIVTKRERNNERYSSIVNTMKLAASMLNENFDYLMVLDGDTILELGYVEKILKKFKEIPNLGLAGGSLIHKTTNREISTADASVVFGSNRIYSKKCWLEINGGKNMKTSSFAWDTEHSARAKNRGFVVKRFDDVTSYSIRMPSLGVPSYSRGILRYQFGDSFPRVLISALINFNIAFLAGYIDAMMNNKKRIDDNKNIMKMKKETDYKFLKSLRLHS